MLSSFENGNLAETATTWTKGKIISKQEKTTSNYDIRDINGKTYLFMQWKSGDYVFRGMEPYYYVLEKVDSQDYSDYKVTVVKEDKVDYPFENDTQMLGNWQSVDFVKNIEQFIPGQKGWLDDLFLTKLVISDNGEIEISSTRGKIFSADAFWTKGLIISKREKTASKCTIKEIDGSTYMFYEWKSGDYTYRGMKPHYYVLKKVD
jgi:bla regulator protein BlaR1